MLWSTARPRYGLCANVSDLRRGCELEGRSRGNALDSAWVGDPTHWTQLAVWRATPAWPRTSLAGEISAAAPGRGLITKKRRGLRTPPESCAGRGIPRTASPTRQAPEGVSTMMNRYRRLHWPVVAAILGVALHVASDVAHTQVSGTGPPVYRAEHPATVTAGGAVPLTVTPGPQAGLGWPSPMPPGAPRGQQLLH